jgi:hypothetical protein
MKIGVVSSPRRKDSPCGWSVVAGKAKFGHGDGTMRKARFAQEGFNAAFRIVPRYGKVLSHAGDSKTKRW